MPSPAVKGEGQEGGRQGPASGGNTLLLETAVDSPTASGEHSVTLPSTFAEDADAFAGVAQSNGKEGGHQGLVTAGHDPCTETNASGLTSKDKGSLATSSFPDDIRARDSFIDVTEGREKEDGSQGPVGHESRPPASAHRPVHVSEGSITIPFSVLDVIRKGPGHIAHGSQNNGLVTYGYYGKGRLRYRLGKSSLGSRREADLRSGCACRRPRAEPYEDVWIWVSMTLCVLWLLCICRLNPGIFPQQVFHLQLCLPSAPQQVFHLQLRLPSAPQQVFHLQLRLPSAPQQVALSKATSERPHPASKPEPQPPPPTSCLMVVLWVSVVIVL
ncbi:receptor-transporting protein 5-like [Eulemur rufifrons]|uniref:receptor-transporting protein 5-like n=1 Tax=Eulemur rufifrons TaxID=859984 RepID=UPI0037429B1A